MHPTNVPNGIAIKSQLGRLYADKIKNSKINLPHKMMHKRNFVLFPLFEIQKNWTHPDKQIDVKTLISRLPVRDIRSIKQI